MNGRELLWDTLSGKKTSRVPVAPFIFSNTVNEYNGGEPEDPIEAGIALYKRFGFDILLRNYIIGDYLDESRISCDSWYVDKQIIGDKGDNWDESTVVTTPERQLMQRKSFRRVSPYEVVEAITEYYIKDPEDFEQFRKYQPPLPQYKNVRTNRRAISPSAYLASVPKTSPLAEIMMTAITIPNGRPMASASPFSIKRFRNMGT